MAHGGLYDSGFQRRSQDLLALAGWSADDDHPRTKRESFSDCRGIQDRGARGRKPQLQIRLRSVSVEEQGWRVKETLGSFRKFAADRLIKSCQLTRQQRGQQFFHLR